MVLINHRKLFVAWHWPILVFTGYRFPTLTTIGIGPLEITWPRLGYWLPVKR